MERSSLCANLRQARRDAKLKQEQVARYLQIPVSAVSGLESGSRKIDALELYQLAKLYNKEIPWFFKGYAIPTPMAQAPDPGFMVGWEQQLEKMPRRLQLKLAYQILSATDEE